MINSKDYAPILDPQEAVRAWGRIYRDREPSEGLRDLCIRLALGMVESEAVRDTVQEAAVRGMSPARGFLRQMSQIADRARVTPLALLAEFDPTVSSFLARHPHAIRALLDEQDEGKDANLDWGLTPRLKRDPRQFLRKMKRVAPILLERSDVGREHTEAFLQHVHTPEVIERLQAVTSVREELGKVLADFCRERGLSGGQEAGSYPTRNIMDNIIWQVAIDLVRQNEDQAGREGLQEVERVLQRVRGGEDVGGRDAGETVRSALAEYGQHRGVEVATRLRESLECEHGSLVHPFV